MCWWAENSSVHISLAEFQENIFIWGRKKRGKSRRDSGAYTHLQIMPMRSVPQNGNTIFKTIQPKVEGSDLPRVVKKTAVLS